jgi:threonylcarbamoyladenosine tRNA methylthiotransferase MtaB
MRRRYNTKIFADLVYKIKNTIPNCCIGIDVITGFPGESEVHFAETCNFINSLPISYLHVFSYSDRDIAVASKFPNKVHPHTIKDRTMRLRELSEIKRNDFYATQINNIKSIIPESFDDKTMLLAGWSDNYVRAEFVGKETDLMLPQKVKFIKLANNIMVSELIS